MGLFIGQVYCAVSIVQAWLVPLSPAFEVHDHPRPLANILAVRLEARFTCSSPQVMNRVLSAC